MLHRKSTYAFLFLTFLLLTVTASATTYYLSSSSGNDSNSGTDPSSAWQTINKLNNFPLQPGDQVLFKRGDTFYGGIKVNSSGSSGNSITYGAYGSGPNPIITGFTKVTSWNNLGGNLWESSNAVSTLSSLKIVVINGVNTPMGRYPNASSSYPFLPNFLHFQSHSGTGSGNTSITSSDLSGGKNWTGADIVVRTNSWTYDRETINSQSGNTLNYTGQSDGIHDNWGFFVQNDIKTLDVQNEWYYSPSTKKITVYSAGMPTNVQVSSVESLFYLNSNVPTVTSTNIDNLSFVGANTNAIWISGNLTFSVTNCNISYSGLEGLLLYGGGIQNGTINNNVFSNCGSSSIASTGSANALTVTNNSLIGSGMISTYKPNDYAGSGMFISTPNSLIRFNTVDSSAYCGIEFTGNNIQVRNNFVNHSTMVRDDAGGIYTGHQNQTGKIIDGNIVLNSVGNTNGGGPGKDLAAYGIFIDDFGSNINITNNTVANCSSAGINLHDTKNVVVNKNTVYNNGMPGWSDGQLFVQADAGQFTSYIRSNSVTNNILFAKNSDQYSLSYYADPNANNDATSFGTFDYNYYAKPINLLTPFTSDQSIAKGQLSLSQWQNAVGGDANSQQSAKGITDLNSLRFEYNASNQSKTIGLDANYIDVKGNNYNGTITLAPYSSAVLIKNGAATANLLPAVNPSNTVNGLDYKYFEATNYTVVPDFSTANPNKTGNVNNFDITIANRTEQFAINFTGYINVPSDGQYTFYTSSDDGSVLYIDGVQVVANDGLHGLTEQSSSIGLKAGLHAISVGYFNATGGKGLQVSYSGPGVNKQAIPSSALYRVSGSSGSLLPAVNPSNTVNGLDYKYFEATNYTVVPDFSTANPNKTGNVNNFDISIANRTEQFAINFTGYINVPSDGQYTFYTSSDDGSVLYIDGVQVVANDGLHGLTEQSSSIGLKAGLHAISVGYFNATGGKGLEVSYSGPGVSKQTIPSAALYRVSSSSGSLLPAVNASNPINGLEYQYYEASNYSVVPDFSGITPVKTGNLNGFDISIANRAEQFAINFMGYVNVPSDGQYTFYTSSDDGSNLYIDGVKVVNNDGSHGLQENSGTIGLQAGFHKISVGYFNATGYEGLQVRYSGPGVTKQAIPSSALYITSNSLLSAVNPSNTVNGLDYKYYEASNYDVVPDFSVVTPIKTGNINGFDISIANRTEQFAINFSGYINVPADGLYTFYTSSDDGSNLYIDGVKVVNNDGPHGQQENSGTIGLQAGLHKISVGYFNATGYEGLQVSYSGSGVSKQTIPSSALYRVSSSSGNLLAAVHPINTVNGLDYKYYEASTYSAVPDFSIVTPIKTGNVNGFDISIANRTEQFAINFTGYINVPADGQYTFYTTSDDGSNLYIDGVKVVNNDGPHGQQENSGTIGLQAGLHLISVGYFNATGYKGLQVSYSGPGVGKQAIPSSALFRLSTLGSQATMVNSSSAMMFANDSTNFQMQRLLNSSQINQGVKVYPNPFRNSIQIDVTGLATSRFKLILLDASGKIVWSKNIENYNSSYHQSVNTSSFPVGVYFLRLIQDNKTFVTKLLKEY